MALNPGQDAFGFFPYPYSVKMLSQAQVGGMLALSILGFVSALSALVSLIGLTRRMIKEKRARQNQCLLLIFNLMIADFFQAIGFLMELHWIQIGEILAPSKTCAAQAAFLNLGDVGSASFVLTIAVWTACQIYTIHTIKRSWLVGGIVGLWTFCILLTTIGPGLYGRQFFTAAGNWCWISPDYESSRLGLHYIWIFIVQFLSAVVYFAMIIGICTSVRKQPDRDESANQWRRTAYFMFAYWVVYTFCTLPLASGRMHVYAGKSVSDTAFAVLGCFLASSGWMDSLLYMGSRWSILTKDTQLSDGWSDREQQMSDNSSREDERRAEVRRRQELDTRLRAARRQRELRTAARAAGRSSVGRPPPPILPQRFNVVHELMALSTPLKVIRSPAKLPKASKPSSLRLNKELPPDPPPDPSPYSQLSSSHKPPALLSPRIAPTPKVPGRGYIAGGWI